MSTDDLKFWTPQDFKAWRKSLGLTQAEAGDAIGVSRGSIELYERGSRREDDRPVIIPKTVALACAAVSAGLTEWKP